jgi:hypothetical protein
MVRMLIDAVNVVASRRATGSGGFAVFFAAG